MTETRYHGPLADRVPGLHDTPQRRLEKCAVCSTEDRYRYHVLGPCPKLRRIRTPAEVDAWLKGIAGHYVSPTPSPPWSGRG